MTREDDNILRLVEQRHRARMEGDASMVRLEEEDCTLVCECTWGEFVEANPDEAEDVRRELDEHGVSSIGGGAAPFVRIVRVVR